MSHLKEGNVEKKKTVYYTFPDSLDASNLFGYLKNTAYPLDIGGKNKLISFLQQKNKEDEVKIDNNYYLKKPIQNHNNNNNNNNNNNDFIWKENQYKKFDIYDCCMVVKKKNRVDITFFVKYYDKIQKKWFPIIQ